MGVTPPPTRSSRCAEAQVTSGTIIDAATDRGMTTSSAGFHRVGGGSMFQPMPGILGHQTRSA
jgi:hypothetical protein